jgi:hypothetical protein
MTRKRFWAWVRLWVRFWLIVVGVIVFVWLRFVYYDMTEYHSSLGEALYWGGISSLFFWVTVVVLCVICWILTWKERRKRWSGRGLGSGSCI